MYLSKCVIIANICSIIFKELLHKIVGYNILGCSIDL